MGLFDFVKEAGEALGSKVFDLANDDQDVTASAPISQARIDELRAQHILKSITELELNVASVSVRVEDELAIIEGRVPDQSSCEKITLAAGNQHGIAHVDCRLSVARTEPESTFYTVQPGDTLSKIAKNFYADASKYSLIFKANQPMLKDPDRIFPGQKLRIPN